MKAVLLYYLHLTLRWNSAASHRHIRRMPATCAGEDMWHAYNLIREGDIVTGSTFRKIQREVGAGTESEKVKIKLSVQVEDVDFDPEGLTLRP